MKFFTLIFALAFLSAFTKPSTKALTINSTGFDNNQGKGVLLVFRKSDPIPESPFKTYHAAIKNYRSEFVIEDLPVGEYAIILLHDANNNGKIDHSYGFPSEQLGYSNDWKLGFFTGLPTFEKLKFTRTEISTDLNINISYKKKNRKS